MSVIEHILLRTAAFALLGAASLGVYLVALRFVVWDLVPTSALPHCRWWQRRAPGFLRVSLMIAAAALGGLGFCMIVMR